MAALCWVLIRFTATTSRVRLVRLGLRTLELRQPRVRPKFRLSVLTYVATLMSRAYSLTTYEEKILREGQGEAS